MHLAINKIVESRLADDKSDDESLKIAVSEKLYFYAEEAYELGHIDDARRHHQTVRYSIFFIRVVSNMLLYIIFFAGDCSG